MHQLLPCKEWVEGWDALSLLPSSPLPLNFSLVSEIFLINFVWRNTSRRCVFLEDTSLDTSVKELLDWVKWGGNVSFYCGKEALPDVQDWIKRQSQVGTRARSLSASPLQMECGSCLPLSLLPLPSMLDLTLNSDQRKPLLNVSGVLSHTEGND